MLLLCGRLADIYGRRKAFILGAAWYIIWSLACGFAQSEIQLAIFRAFQGIGSAAIIPSAVSSTSLYCECWSLDVLNGSSIPCRLVL